MTENSELMIDRLNIENGKIDLSLTGKPAGVFFNWIIDMFEESGAENFLSMTFERDNKKYDVQIINCHGELSAAEKINQLQEEIRQLKEGEA